MSDLTVIEDKLLSTPEIERMNELEIVIEKGLTTFFEVGNALMEIRDSRLYRQTHNTFEDYCNQRWNFTRQRAAQLITAASVVTEITLTTSVDQLPQNEAVVRPLSKVAPEKQAEAWALAVATAPDGKVTRDHVAATVDRFLGKAGRFEPKLYYGVDWAGNLVYTPGFEKAYTDDKRPFGLEMIKGGDLNRDRRSDGLNMIEFPPPPERSFNDVFGEDKSWGAYPVDKKNRIIYNDFHTGFNQPRYYAVHGCEWVYRSELAARWESVKHRWHEFEVRPPMDWKPPVWVMASQFQPGQIAICPQCNQWNAEQEYSKWVPVSNQIWICKYGHQVPDDAMKIQAVLPGLETAAAQEDIDSKYDDDEDDFEDDENLDEDKDEGATEAFPKADETEDDDPEGYDPDLLDWLGTFQDDLLKPIINDPTKIRQNLAAVAHYNRAPFNSPIESITVRAIELLIETFGPGPKEDKS